MKLKSMRDKIGVRGYGSTSVRLPRLPNNVYAQIYQNTDNSIFPMFQRVRFTVKVQAVLQETTDKYSVS